MLNIVVSDCLKPCRSMSEELLTNHIQCSAADQLAVLLQSLPDIVRKASWSPPIDIFAAEVTNQVRGAGGLVAILFAGQFEIDLVQNKMAIAGEATPCCHTGTRCVMYLTHPHQSFSNEGQLRELRCTTLQHRQSFMDDNRLMCRLVASLE
jgi:hypothetical protein